MATIPNVRLSLSNRAENVALVRQVLAGLGHAIALDPVELNDINTAVSEACNNVVLHAYAGQEGPLEVEMRVSPLALEIVVRDQGGGIRPPTQGPSEPADGGIGLPVIQALAHRVEISDLDGAGTEVHMEFAVRAGAALEPMSGGELDRVELSAYAPPRCDDTIAMAIAPNQLALSILPRVLCSLAARARFSTDRISDTQLLADALLAHLGGSLGASHLGFQMSVARHELELRMGPMHDGGARALIENCAVDGLGPVIERLTDDHRVASAGDRELLALRLIERGQPSQPLAGERDLSGR
jgi:serine/threonine-protein kinase RsbW